MRKKLRLWIAAAILCAGLAGLGFFLHRLYMPQSLTDETVWQVLIAEYYDRETQTVIPITEYSEEKIFSVLNQFEERRTPWTFNGFSGYENENIVLSITLAGSRIKVIYVGEDQGWTTRARGSHKYRIAEPDLLLEKLLDVLEIPGSA